MLLSRNRNIWKYISRNKEQIMTLNCLGQRSYEKDNSNDPEDEEKSLILKKMRDQIEMDKRSLKWRSDSKQWSFKSKLKLFANEQQTSDFLVWMQKPFTFHPSDWKESWKRFTMKREQHLQQFIPHRHEVLGPDLASAHFILFRGGSVKFRHSSKWYQANVDNEFDLPNRYDPLYKVEAIKCDNMNLHYVGLNNLRWLQHLRSLSFHNVELFDDWCLDRVSGLECPNLERLDISKTKCTYNGLSCIYRFNALKLLIVSDRNTSIPFQLSCALLEESKPSLQIVSDDIKYRS